MTKTGNQDPANIDFARRFINEYLEVDVSLGKELKPFENISVEDANTIVDDSVREIIVSRIKKDATQILNVTRYNSSYFNFIIYVIRLILDLTGESASKMINNEFKVDQVRPEPKKTNFVDGGYDYYRSSGKKWSKIEIFFLKARLKDKMKTSDIIREFRKDKNMKVRSKKSVYGALSKIRKGRIKRD